MYLNVHLIISRSYTRLVLNWVLKADVFRVPTLLLLCNEQANLIQEDWSRKDFDKKFSTLVLKFLSNLSTYLIELKQPLYFYSIREKKVSEYLSIYKNKTYILLEVIEFGEHNLKHYHAITNKQLNKMNWSKVEEQEITSIPSVLYYMQKEQKNQLRWSHVDDSIPLQELLNKSRHELEYELETSLKFQYKVDPVDYFEWFESSKNKDLPPYLSEQQKIKLLIIKHLVYLSNRLHLDIYLDLSNKLINKQSKKHLKTESKVKWEILDYLFIQREKKLIFHILTIIIFEGGILNQSLNSILILIGKLIKDHYLKEELRVKLTSKTEILIAIEWYKSIELVLINTTNTYILKTKNETDKISLLERLDNNITTETYLSIDFKKLLQITNELVSNQSLFLKPLNIDLQKKKIGFHYTNWLHPIYLDEVLEIKPKLPLVLDYLQQQRWYIIPSVYNYVFNNISMLWNVIKHPYLSIPSVDKPNYNEYKRSTIFNLNNLFYRNKIKGTMLSEQIYIEIIKLSNNMKIFSKKPLQDKLIYLSEYFKDLFSKENSSINMNVFEVILTYLEGYHQLSFKFKSWIEFRTKQKSLKDKFEKLLRILSQLKLWRKDYMEIDGKESIYFLWAPDKRGRVYQISELTPLSDKFIRRILTISPFYSFKDYEDLIFISISKFFYGGKKTNEEYLLLFKENSNHWIDLNPDLLIEADDLMGFISYILEYKNYLSDPNYKTNLMLELDGTNNVYQLMSLIANDKILAEQVNIINSADNKPQDLYALVATELTNRLNFTITRKEIKKSVMCYAYGLTDYGMLEYLRESSPSTEYDKLMTITKELKSVLEHKYKSIVLIRTLLETLVKLKYTQNKFIDSQCVFIENHFIKYKHLIFNQKKEVVVFTSTNFLSKGIKKEEKMRVYITSPLPTLNKKKMVTSITANYIHSIDAECLLTLLFTIVNKENFLFFSEEEKKYCNIFTIHDCFMFPAPLYVSIFKLYKVALISLDLNEKLEILFKNNLIDIQNDKNWILFKKNQQKNPITSELIFSSDYILN